MCLTRIAQQTTNEQTTTQALNTTNDEDIVDQTHQVRFEDTTTTIEIDNKLTFQKLYSSVNPYPDETPTQLLSRIVRIPNLPWGPTGISGATFWNNDPIRLLVANSPSHAMILGNICNGGTFSGMYRYLQCSVEVTFKLNTTPYHQGVVCIGWAPQLVPNACFTKYYAPQMDGTFLSASVQDQAVITMPFCSSRPHYDLLGSYLQSHPSTIWMVVINTLVQTQPNITDTVDISCWIQLKDIKVYGIIPQPVPSDMKIPAKRRLLASKTKQQTDDNSFEEQASFNRGKTNKESQAKQEVGISAKGIVEAVTPMLSSVPIVGDIVKLGSILMNMSKPTSDQATTFTMNRENRGHSMQTGQDYSEPLSPFPSWNVSKDLGLESSEMLAVDFAKKPCMLYQLTAQTKGILDQLVIHPMNYFVSTQRTEPDYLAFTTSMFNYWRGSIKLLFQFVGSPFYSCRFRITVSHTNAVPVAIGDGTGHFSRVVDVKGDTWCSITVPYLNKRVWSYTTESYEPTYHDYSYLTIEALTDVMGSSLPSTAKIFINIFRGAGNDFQLAGPRDAQGIDPPTTQPNRNSLLTEDMFFEEQCSLKKKFTETFEGITDQQTGMMETGLLMSSTASTLSDLCKSFQDYNAPPTFPSFSYPNTSGSPAMQKQPLFFLASAFLYWRGSRRFKATLATAINSKRVTLLNFDLSISRSAPTALYDQCMASAVVPWDSVESYFPTDGRDFINAFTYARPRVCFVSPFLSDLGTFQFFLAGGDDFLYFFPVQPFVSSLFTPEPSKSGTKKT
jgi:hypothetical protein